MGAGARVPGLLSRLPTLLGRVISRGVYRPEIDGLRFVAIGFVIIGHVMERAERAAESAGLLSGSWHALFRAIPSAGTGVFLFFAVSSYILASQFRRQRERDQPFSYGQYMGRRLQRIVPPYALILLASLLIAAVGYRPEFVSVKSSNSESLLASFFSALFYVHGLIFGALPRLFPPGWSLEPEVHFYILAPFMFAALFPRGGGSRKAIGLWAFAVSIPVCAVASLLLRGNGYYYFSLLHFMPFFLAGIVAAEWCPARTDEERSGWTRWDSLGFLGLAGLAGTGLLESRFAFTAAYFTLDPLRTVTILAVMVGAVRGNLFYRLLSIRGIAFIGGAAYSIYLTHLQVMQVMTPVLMHLLKPATLAEALIALVPAELAVALVVGLGFYALIERYFMRPDALRWNRKPVS